jgi:peroxiredoxin
MKKTLTALFLVLSLLTYSQIADKAENISPLLIGEQIPDIVVYDVSGKPIQTKTIFDKKTVLVVYRGGWCPYCNAQLADLQELESDILALGYQIVAISPDAPRFLQQTVEDEKLNYTLYSDSKGDFSQAVGIAFAKSKGKLDKYSEGQNPGFLPVPTVYILDSNSEIQFLYINPNYTKRLDGKVLLAVLKSL